MSTDEYLVLSLEPENMIVKALKLGSPGEVLACPVPEFLSLNSDPKINSEILHEVSEYSSRFF